MPTTQANLTTQRQALLSSKGIASWAQTTKLVATKEGKMPSRLRCHKSQALTSKSSRFQNRITQLKYKRTYLPKLKPVKLTLSLRITLLTPLARTEYFKHHRQL